MNGSLGTGIFLDLDAKRKRGHTAQGKRCGLVYYTGSIGRARTKSPPQPLCLELHVGIELHVGAMAEDVGRRIAVGLGR